MERKQLLLRTLKHFIVFTFFVALFITGSIIAENNAPTRLTYQDGDWDWKYIPTEWNSTQYNVLLDQHSHTTASDGKLTPQQNLEWHLANGFNAMVLTDHSTYKNSLVIRQLAREKYNTTMKVLIGSEWSTNRIHMNLIFPPNASATDYESLVVTTRDPTDAQIQDIINKTHAVGGLVTVNHYPWSLARMSTHPTRQQVIAWGVDFIEINGGDYDYESTVLWTNTSSFGIITGTDMHTPGKVYGWTQLNASYTEEAIFEELKAHRTTIIFNSTGSPYLAHHKENPEYTWLKPLIVAGQAFQNYDLGGGNLDWIGIIILAFYGYGAFFIVELVLIFIQKKKEKPKQIEHSGKE